MDRITSEKIIKLKDDEIFVFGSNLKGHHGAGAALMAYNKFGAEIGLGIGRCGKTYAIPTKDHYLRTLRIFQIKSFVEDFLNYTVNFPQYKFLVTEIGCGLAGYQPSEIAPLFKPCRDIIYYKNIHLPIRFWDIIK